MSYRLTPKEYGEMLVAGPKVGSFVRLKGNGATAEIAGISFHFTGGKAYCFGRPGDSPTEAWKRLRFLELDYNSREQAETFLDRMCAETGLSKDGWNLAEAV